MPSLRKIILLLYFRLHFQAAKTLHLILGKSPSNCCQGSCNNQLFVWFFFFLNLVSVRLCSGDPALGYLRERELKALIQTSSEKENVCSYSFGVYNTSTYIISFNYPIGCADTDIIIVPDFQMRCYLKRSNKGRIKHSCSVSKSWSFPILHF